ncbi:transmembrane protein, putative (macronuclear) [Tetrahymena thermophila SB210]|uniref:Transmembrane protein, putative n=1 Tax=Tetrahymena thermophila (strain SB210) TaxID=312017 RepID=W7XEB0_TETTS|nr:transmembrane protein, putative [Tetrahymena thermophila SB210]EWS74908.1 transmembrane protein, putative [Tetrahymena thermophila SB210]|eukprot:XP_012652621.1 transmembrane protein, putative [Tetrahymena thermophila SB210]
MMPARPVNRESKTGAKCFDEKLIIICISFNCNLAFFSIKSFHFYINRSITKYRLAN